MAVDGVLRFNTKIDADGFIKGTDKLSSKAVELKYKISAAEREVKNLTEELKKMADTPIKSDAVASLEKQVEKAKSKFNELTGKADEMFNKIRSEQVSMGFGDSHLDDILSRNSEWQKLQNQISEADTALLKYERELESAKATESQVTGKDTAEYAQKKQKIEDLNAQIDVYKAKLRETTAQEKKTASSEKSVSKQTVNVTKIFQRLSKALKEVTSRMKNAFKNTVVNSLKRLTSNAKKTNSQMGVLAKSLNRIKQALAGMLLYKVLSGSLNSLTEGFNNLAKESPKVNESLSALMTSLEYMKNSLASAFAPILNVVTPILTKFMDIISEVTNKVGQFIATLTGQTTYTKAIKVQKDYAESLDDTTKATENLEKETGNLASFDELNVMQQQDTSKSSDTGTDSGTLFETIPTVFSDFASKLKEAFTKGNFNEIGQLVADKLNQAMKSIKWSKIRSTAKKWASNIAEFLNGAVEKLDWFLTGTTIGNGIMTAVDFAYTFLNKFNFENFGKGLAKSLNGIIKSIDWKKLGSTFGSVVQSIISTGFGFVTTFDWVALGKSISDSINEFFKKIDWKKAGKTISKGVVGAFNTISTALKKVDWKQIGKDVADFLTNIDWWGILEEAGEAIWNALTGLLEFFSGMSGKSKVVNTLGKLADNFQEFAKVAWSKLKTACTTVLKPLADFTLDKVVPVILEALSGALKLFSGIIKKINPQVMQVITSAISGVISAILLFKGIEKAKSAINMIQSVIIPALKGLANTLKIFAISHPILLIVSAIGALAVACATYTSLNFENSSIGKACDRLDDLSTKIHDSTDGVKDAISTAENELSNLSNDFSTVDDLQDRLEELVNKGTLSESEKADMDTIADLLKERVPGFESAWNSIEIADNNGTYIIGQNKTAVINKIDEVISAYKKQAAEEAISNQLLNLYDQDFELDNSVKSAEEKLKAEKANFEKLLANNGMTYEQYIEFKYNVQNKQGVISTPSQRALIENEKKIHEAEIALNSAQVAQSDLNDEQERFEKLSKVVKGDYSDLSSVLDAYERKMIDADTVQEKTGKTIEQISDSIPKSQFKISSSTSTAYYNMKNSLDNASIDWEKYSDTVAFSANGVNYTLHDLKSMSVKEFTEMSGYFNTNDWTTWGSETANVGSIVSGVYNTMSQSASDNADNTEKSLAKNYGTFKKTGDNIETEADRWSKVSMATADEMDKSYSKGFDNIEENCGNMWNNIKAIFTDGINFDNFVTSIWTVFKNALNNLIDGLNNVIKYPFESLNNALSGLRDWEFAGIEPFSWIPEIGIPQIPKLATGAYVPANYGEFLAILGDNKREPEFVMPESKLDQAVSRAMEKYGFNKEIGDIHVTVTMPDGTVLFNVVANENDQYKKRHGHSRLV